METHGLEIVDDATTKEAKKEPISTSLCLDPNELQVRVAAHSFAKEFWNEVIDVTEGDADALIGVYAALAVLIERERLYHLTFHFLYAFHLWMGAETTLPVDQLEKKPALTEDFLQVFILFSQVILEGLLNSMGKMLQECAGLVLSKGLTFTGMCDRLSIVNDGATIT